MNGAVNDEASRVDRVRRRFDRPPLQVDLHQAGGRDFVEQQAVRVDQEVMLRPWQAQGYVGEDQVAHAKMRDQPITGGEFLAQALLGGVHGRYLCR